MAILVSEAYYCILGGLNESIKSQAWSDNLNYSSLNFFNFSFLTTGISHSLLHYHEEI